MTDAEIFRKWFNELGNDAYFMVDTDPELEPFAMYGLFAVNLIDYEIDVNAHYVKEEYMPKDLLAYVLINES